MKINLLIEVCIKDMCTSIMSIIVILFFSIFCFMETSFATNIPNMVLMNFSNNTHYEKINSPEILSEFLIDDIAEIQDFNLIEYSYDEDVLEAEKKLNADVSTIKDAMAKDDFAYIFNVHNDEINEKEKGDSLPLEHVQKIAKKNNADYILHGSVDFLDSSVKEFMTVSKAIGGKDLCIEVMITVRIIQAKDGMVVWKRNVKGVGNDSSIVIKKDFRIGTDNLNAELFYDALKKASKKIVKDLKKDLEKGYLVLQ